MRDLFISFRHHQHKQTVLKAKALGPILFLLYSATSDASVPQSTLDPQGPVAHMQLDVFMVTVVICTAVFILTGGLLAYTVWRFRARPGQTEAPLKHVHGNPKLEFGLMGIVAILLIGIAIPNMKVLFATSSLPADQPALQVDATGKQWWWKFTYPELGIVTANELHIPVGQPINASLISEDVIHSFWVPKLAGKVDVIPNKRNSIWFQADQPGVFYGQCAEFCGVSHANMRFRVIAHHPADFKRWAEAQRRPSPAPENPLARRGEQLFNQKGCTTCHAIAGTAAQGQIGPDLTHMGNRLTLAAGLLDNTTEHLVRWLQNPQAIKPGSLMPNLELTGQEAQAIAAYLNGLIPPGKPDQSS